jgi:hypothetical protein
MDELALPDDALVVGAEIAHGANGVVHDATLYGVRVCAKVRRQHADRRAQCGLDLWACSVITVDASSVFCAPIAP